MRIKLENEMSYGYGPNGERLCRGAMMGRANTLPDGPLLPVKLRMERLRFVDGCYDTGGAYWGMPANLYCAHADGVRAFARGDTRDQAKAEVRETLPNATFFR